MNTQFRHISREKAAEQLNVSVRTVDRYIRRGFLEIKRLNRNVFISRPSFERYYQEQIDKGLVESKPKTNSSKAKPVTETIETIETIEVSESDASEAGARMAGPTVGTRAHEANTIGGRHPHSYATESVSVSIYKELYEELKEKNEEQVKRLEGAHYRVGQLEAQVKNMVPMLEFKQERKRLTAIDQQYKQDIKQAKVRVVQSRRLIETERFNKNVYIALVYGMLALQPVFWVLLQA
jgi:hypothetical protein